MEVVEAGWSYNSVLLLLLLFKIMVAELLCNNHRRDVNCVIFDNLRIDKRLSQRNDCPVDDNEDDKEAKAVKEHCENLFLPGRLQ